MTVSGKVTGSDGASILIFDVQGQDPFGSIISDQTFNNGIWQLDVDPSEIYYFTALPVYGTKGIQGSQLTAGMNVIIPKNFDGLPVASDAAIDTYYVIGGALILLTFILEKNKNKNKKVGSLDPKDVESIMLIGGGILAITLGKKFLTSLGIMDSADTTNLNNIANSSNTFWSPTYYQQFTTYTYTISTDQATTMANQIYDAMGIFSDNVAQVMAVFRSLKTKANVSFLAKVFNDVYGQDLLTYLRGGIWPEDHLSDADVNTINSFLSTLPSN